MRRSEREIKDKSQIESILKKGFICHLGLTDGEQPYVVPMNYAYKNSSIYLHCASEGRKLDLIRKNNKVCFQIEIASSDVVRTNNKPCDWGMNYQSVIGIGLASILTDDDEKIRALKAIVEIVDDSIEVSFPEEALAATTVIRIDIREMTGKFSKG